MRLAKIACILLAAWPAVAHPASVRTGLDNVGEHKDLFQGKRLGIIANHTSYDSQGKYIVDVLRAMEGVRVVALFSPEHGLRGLEEAGAKVGNETDPVTGLPVYSLFGKISKPTPQMLADVDVLVFDIQDVGARFYTYLYTMSLAMEAAAENGKRFVVLDRPNPINGVQLEGPVLEPKFATFVGLYPIPVRYGLTVGELARMINGEGWLAKGVKADLTVVPLTGWRRDMWFDQTGLRFIKPSPNMPDLETAALYPGLCLLEGTNVSEGRGTAQALPPVRRPLDRRERPGREVEQPEPAGRAIPASLVHPHKLEVPEPEMSRRRDRPDRPHPPRTLLDRRPDRQRALPPLPHPVQMDRRALRPPLRHRHDPRSDHRPEAPATAQGHLDRGVQNLRPDEAEVLLLRVNG